MNGPHLDPRQLGAYFALTEATSLLQHQVEQHLRTEGGLSSVQFQLLARLANAPDGLTMTELADGVVYSRSGLTYQAGLLEKAGLVVRTPSPDDERATLVRITDAGRDLFFRVLPGHVEVVRRMLFDALSDEDVDLLGDVMSRLRDHMRALPPRSAAPRGRRGQGSPMRARAAGDRGTDSHGDGRSDGDGHSDGDGDGRADGGHGAPPRRPRSIPDA
ncbi:MAG TPA: MarR family transcriptional regulator [Acidimicrobiales bacterium]